MKTQQAIYAGVYVLVRGLDNSMSRELPVASMLRSDEMKIGLVQLCLCNASHFDRVMGIQCNH
jgi:hypothetical protein